MNTPVFDPDDPRLTAYALGESDPAEREAVEQILAASPEARAEVERTSALARALEEEYDHENEAYWKARATEPPPGKVVAFPFSRKGGLKWTAAPGWKIAAAIVALGALTPLALRRAPSSRTVTSEPPRPAATNSPSSVAAPPPVETSPAAKSVAQADAPADTARDQPVPAATEPGANLATPDADALVAMDTERTRRDETASASAINRRSAPAMATADAAKPSMQRPVAAPPEAPASGASAGVSGGVSGAPIDRIGRSLVRIRTADGSVVGGVAVTAEGGILAAQPLPVAGTRPTVLFANGSETSATILGDSADLGLCRLQIEGATLPAVALATKAPADKAALSAVTTDRRTGATRFLRAHAVVSGAEASLQWEDQLPTDDETRFVFNLNGELLKETAAAPAAKTETRAKSGSGSTVPPELRVRPYTAAERALLHPSARDVHR